jgi:hypothetical protein
MVSGRKQCVDSAYVKANASLDSLQLRQELPDQQAISLQTPYRRAKIDKSNIQQRSLAAKEHELAQLETRHSSWREKQKRKPGALERSRFLSNLTHYSPTDPDAKIAVKVGKPRQLCYLASIAVDAAKGVITHIQAHLADKKDSRYLQEIFKQTKGRLHKQGLPMHYLIADAGYSSGDNYAFLESQNIQGYIPVHSQYQNIREGFSYEKENDRYICPQGKALPMSRIFVDKEGYWKKTYRASRKECNRCPIRETCLGKAAKEKKFETTYFRSQYERAYLRQHSAKGQYLKKLRQSTVEPVLGTLLNFLGMRKVNVRGQKGAYKLMLMAATAFNLKKYLNYSPKTTIAIAKEVVAVNQSLYCYVNTIYLTLYQRKTVR